MWWVVVVGTGEGFGQAVAVAVSSAVMRRML